MADFKSLLDKRVDDAKKPTPLPAGQYEGRVLKYDLDEARNDEKTPICRFTVQLTAPGEEIEREDLVDAEGNEIDITQRRLRSEFWLRDDSLWRLTEFLQSCGIETEGRSFGETLPDTKNADVLVTVTQTQSKDGQETYNNISKITGTANA